MRVLHVVRQFHPSVGGLESVVLSLSKQQRRCGIDAEVLTLNRLFRRPDTLLPAEDYVEGIPVRRIEYSGSNRYPIAPRVLGYLKGYDLIHVHGVDFFADYLAATSGLHKRPMVISTHGGFFHTDFALGLKRVYFQTVTRMSLRKYQRVFACSANDARTFQPVAGSRVKLIDNGVNTEKFLDASPTTFSPSLVYFGRFASHKGLHRLLDVFRAILQIFPDARLTFIGSDWDGTLASVQKRANDPAFDGKITIATDLDDASTRARLQKCSFFISASEYEGFGLTVVEALSAGLVPIVSAIPTFKQIIDQAGVGLVADFGNIEDAARKIADFLLQSATPHATLRARAMSASQPYNWETVEREFRAEYESILGVPRRTILGVDMEVMTRNQMVSKLDDALERREQLPVAFANAHTLNVANERPGFRALLKRFLVVNDGFGVDIASKMKFGRRFPENLNGTDFVPHFLGASQNRLRIFLLGARPHAVRAAARRISETWPRHEIAGVRDGYFRDEAQILDVCRAINRSKADVVLVGLGNPLQEQWISRYGPHLDARLLIAVGALFDFLGGNVRRAPMWIRKARCEWVYRLAQEPRRLVHRYLVGNAVFLYRSRSDRRQRLAS
jgi:alpha-1,3-mannosyltransferase